jgi:hypothetical protein
MLRITDFQIGGKWGFEIGSKLGKYRNYVSLFRKRFEGCQGWLYRIVTHGRENEMKRGWRSMVGIWV